MQNKTPIILFFFLFFVTASITAQKQVNSPYSRFNIGMLEPAGSFKSQGMGGVGIALRDNTSLFLFNPASYSSIDTTSFVFDFGFDYSINRISSGDQIYTSDDMNFDHIILGFPLAKGFGVSAGIVPLSNGYYRLIDRVTDDDPDYDPAVGEYTSSHSGTGGLSTFFIGTGLKINRFLSAGINMSILFGDITRNNSITFADIENHYHNSSSEKLQAGGINFDYGLQLTLPLNERNFLNAGVSYTTGKRFNAGYEQYTYRYTSLGVSDTISYVSENSGNLYIPGTFRAGLAVGRTDKMTIALDYVTTGWSEAEIPGAEGTAANSSAVMFGLEYTPDKFSNLSSWRRIDYRFGAHSGKSYLLLNGEQVKETGVSIGLGIPLRRSLSKANIFADYTRRSGETQARLHSENYFTIGASINLYDWWFLQRRYE